MDRHMDGGVDGWMDRHVDGGVDGWMDRYLCCQMDGWMDGQTYYRWRGRSRWTDIHVGFSLQLHFPLVAMLTFCKIIRKCDHQKF